MLVIKTKQIGKERNRRTKPVCIEFIKNRNIFSGEQSDTTLDSSYTSMKSFHSCWNIFIVTFGSFRCSTILLVAKGVFWLFSASFELSTRVSLLIRKIHCILRAVFWSYHLYYQLLMKFILWYCYIPLNLNWFFCNLFPVAFLL